MHWLMCKISVKGQNKLSQCSYIRAYIRDTRGVHSIVALGFCKAHYETYPYFIRFNRLIYSPLTETQALNANKYAFSPANPVDTENGTVKSTLRFIHVLTY